MDERFATPVYVIDGSRITREIACLGDAIDFLEAPRAPINGTVHETRSKHVLARRSDEPSNALKKKVHRGIQDAVLYGHNCDRIIVAWQSDRQFFQIR